MRIRDITEGVGRITKQNQTVDVGPDEVTKQAAKFGNKVDKDGRPPTLSKKVKGKSTNVLFNLGLAEGYKLQLERDKEMLVLNITDTASGKRTEVRGKSGYESGGYDPKDKLHKLLDKIGKSADISQLMNGEPVGINPKHPQGASAKDATDKAYHESLEEALGEIAPNTEIYVDMDGVLADFFGEWSKSQGVDNWKDIKDPAKAIGDIKSIEDFWLNLPVLPKAKELLGLIKQVKGKYKICTSPLADDPRSEPHKREWVKKNLAFFPPEEVIVTHNKPQFATQKDGTPNILIDDYGVNINAWEKAGGIGFKYKDYKFNRTAKAIKNKIEEPVEENFADSKKKVQEAFNNPYPITWEYLNPTGASSGIVKLDDGSALDIHFSEEPAGVYEIEFARDGSKKQMGRSGQGDEFRVFATVQAAMLKWWKQLDKTSARKITFYANKQDGNRARLYKRFLKMWGDKSGWEIEVSAKSGLAAYSLTNPKPDKPKNGKKTFMQRVFGKKETVENFAESDVPLGKYLYHVAYASGLTGMLRDGHLGEPDEYFSMTSDQKYIVSGNPEVQIVIDTAKVSKMETFEKYVDDWESTPGAGDWAKGGKGDFESEYRVEETIPWDYVVAVKILKSKATKEIIQLAKQRGVKLIGKDNNVTENFADGKRKGKSRPGRVKKSGASCNGTVTQLRKRAKNASGEKAKMYHWCANMKSGKKKK